MRKLILTASLVLMSVSAQAGPTRGLVMASAEAPKSTVAEQIKALGPETPAMQKVDAKVEKNSETAVIAPKAEAKSEAKPNAEPETKATTKPQSKSVSKKRETDEQKARRIAARYGIFW